MIVIIIFNIKISMLYAFYFLSFLTHLYTKIIIFISINRYFSILFFFNKLYFLIWFYKEKKKKRKKNKTKRELDIYIYCLLWQLLLLFNNWMNQFVYVTIPSFFFLLFLFFIIIPVKILPDVEWNMQCE